MKQLLRKLLRKTGFDLKRYRPQSAEPAQLAAMFAHHGINLVLDVGANVGQYVKALREAGYAGQVISFEPMLEAWQLLQRASEMDELWEVAPRTAVGAHSGHITLNIAGNSASSSVRPMLAAHEDAAPTSKYVSTEQVLLHKLDDVAAERVTDATCCFLKVDTQGYEEDVLKGAARILSTAKGVQLELSLVPLYEGQALYDSLLTILQEHGFELWSLWPGLINPQTGRMLQADAIFFRANEKS